ncbi:ferredoxin [Fervidicoccus sp.]|uniref:ferredoxin n=1 Tax=Fervidicoccus sp. TaxID=2060324 RepID=UPI003D0D87B1
MGKIRVIVDRRTCIACGVAPTVCSEIFQLGLDNGKNRVIDKYSMKLTDEISEGEIPEELYECAKRAEESCPVVAIHVERI